MMDDLKLQNVIEGALHCAGHPLTAGDVQNLFEVHEKPEKNQVEAQFIALQNFYEGRGIELIEVANGWRFQVRQGLSEWVGRLFDEKPQRYTRATLETLALIAYRQPITRGEIEDVRGVVVSSHIIRTLLEREWIKIVGHRDVPGRPALFATTREFLDYFSLKGLDELPPLSELKDMSHNNEELAFDEPVEEGNFDFTQQKRDATESEAQLASADEDIQRAEAMVAQVEENIFRAKEEAEAQDNEEAEEEKRQAMIKEHEASVQSNNFASLADTFAENTPQSETSQNADDDTIDDSAFNFDALANNFSGDNNTVSSPSTNEQESSSALSNMARHLDTANQNAADSLTPEQALAPSEQVQRDALDKFLADGGVLDGTGDFDLADLLKNYTGETAGDEHSGE